VNTPLSSAAAKLMTWFLLGLVRVLTGSQARWQGCPPKAEQRIYFANHQSHADLVMVWAALPKELRSVTRAPRPKTTGRKTPCKPVDNDRRVQCRCMWSATASEAEDPLQPLVRCAREWRLHHHFSRRAHAASTGETTVVQGGPVQPGASASRMWCWCRLGSTTSNA
jgi:hypothetical protein